MRGVGPEKPKHKLEVPKSVPVKPRVLVVGAGAAGSAVARLLSGFGVAVIAIDKGEAAGVDAHGVETRSSSQLARLEGDFGDFEATVRTPEGVVDSELGGLVLAVGLERRQPKALPLSVTLDEFRRAPSKGGDTRRICFAMDLEQNTPLPEFASAVETAAGAAEKGAAVYFLCREVKVADDGLERLYREAREQGVLFVKYGDRPEISILGQEASIQVVDESPGVASHLARLHLKADVVVLPETFAANPDNVALAELLGVELDAAGFFQPANVRYSSVSTNRRGILAVGDCKAPSTGHEIEEQAEAAAEELAAMLAAGETPVAWRVAVVDPDKCAFCLTCNRICPHKAAGMDLEQESAAIPARACWGCGVCVAECPAVAITMEQFDDADLTASFAAGGAR